MPKDGFTVFIKLRHDGYNYKMCGNQVDFNYDNFDNFYGLFNTVVERLNETLDEYKITQKNIVLIHTIF